MLKYLGNVRYWMNSGKHMLALSFSGFDPRQTSNWQAADRLQESLDVPAYVCQVDILPVLPARDIQS
jgi:hypothetical protein